jgi:hypothetical protein
MLSVANKPFVLSVIMLSVDTLNVVILNVVAPMVTNALAYDTIIQKIYCTRLRDLHNITFYTSNKFCTIISFCTCHSHPSPIFSGKARRLLSECKPLRGSTRVGSNVSQRRHWLAIANTPAYYNKEKSTTVKVSSVL